MPKLVVGPLLRFVSDTQATIWVETDEACEVEVLGHSDRTFCVQGHHYALVCIHDLEPGSANAYEVELDGDTVWPESGSDFPPSCIRTLAPDTDVRVSFGSCRQALPDVHPYTHSKDHHEDGAEVDALNVLARELMRAPDERWPSLLMLLGDQVYVDEGSPETRAFIRSRRDTSVPPGEEVLDFEEYTSLYRESWTEPVIRWLFSTVPTAMIIDDHDMSDDWNISYSWKEEMDRKDWWHTRTTAGFATYWLYQHLGNLSPAELAEDETFAAARDDKQDATDVLTDYAHRAYSDHDGVRWSFMRDLGSTRVIVMDNRGGRVLEADRRLILNDGEREWVQSQAEGDFDHLILAFSDPFLLTRTFHHMEAWNEAVCDGAWGPQAAKVGEKMRRAVDFDHWSAFGESFTRMTEFLKRVGTGECGQAPASIVMISGDVHHAYLAEVAFRRDAQMKSAVWQAVCSPFRNPLNDFERRVIRLSTKKPVEAAARGLARLAGVDDADIRWRFTDGPCFDNQVGTLHISGRGCEMTLEKTTPGETDQRSLDTSFRRRLA